MIWRLSRNRFSPKEMHTMKWMVTMMTKHFLVLLFLLNELNYFNSIFLVDQTGGANVSSANVPVTPGES